MTMIKPSRESRRAPFALAALGSLALAAGCGSYEEAQSTSTTASTVAGSQPPAQLVEQADAICAAVNEDRPAAPPIDTTDPNPADLKAAADYFQDDLKLTQRAYGQLVELAPPGGLETQWDGVLAGFSDGVIGNYPDLIAAAKQGDIKAFLAALEAIQTDTADLPQFASEVGLEVCATAG